MWHRACCCSAPADKRRRPVCRACAGTCLLGIVYTWPHFAPARTCRRHTGGTSGRHLCCHCWTPLDLECTLSCADKVGTLHQAGTCPLRSPGSQQRWHLRCTCPRDNRGIRDRAPCWANATRTSPGCTLSACGILETPCPVGTCPGHSSGTRRRCQLRCTCPQYSWNNFDHDLHWVLRGRVCRARTLRWVGTHARPRPVGIHLVRRPRTQ